MADDLSVQLLAFNFSSRTYAYKCLAQALSKSVTGFSSFIRHYLDSCLAANICTQYMDDIGSTVKDFDELIPSLRKIFECIRTSGLKLSPNKCIFATQKVKFLGKNNNTRRYTSGIQKNLKVSENNQVTSNTKTGKAFSWYCTVLA